MFRLGRGRPVIDPFQLASEKGLCLPCGRVVVLLTDFMFKYAMRLLEDVERVGYYAPASGFAKGRYGGVEVFLTRPYFGAPAVATTLEMLVAGGGRVFVVVGEVGALNPVLRIGDILVPTWGLREEGVSFHYMPPNYVPKPDRELAGKLFWEVRRVKGRRRIRVVKGGVWSTDALFRETKDKVVEYSRIGVLGVDMESTALMTVAAYRKVKLAVVAAVSDELYGEEWRKGFGTGRLRRTEKIVVKAALNTITQYGLG
ncbi:MAG: hypothetical protein DRN04_18680 [Thermoprotei archaeon]|nr:MAG: hypothetical protein DRN04_18680 [Thermoprotei archaeon]